MPTLEWIGKSKVVNHHLEVPYQVLERKYSYDEKGQHDADNGSQNMIIHGDNLAALKSLLPQYEGRIQCIYLDPPYNTGNEGWVYNDNVNDPRIKKWLGEVVGKEGEDLSRHDKWLCMMYPRLKLLQRLLADDGAVFISIDDNEQANLKLICDEIFGANNFKADISWQRNYSARNDSKGIVCEVEHILVYSKTRYWQPLKLSRTEEMDAKYKNPDNDVMAWTSSDAFAPDAATHQGMVYGIQHPFTGKFIYPYKGSHWRYQKDEMLAIMNGWCPYRLEDLHDENMRADVCGVHTKDVKSGIKAIVLAQSVETSKSMAQQVYQRGKWPKLYFTRNGLGGIRRKTYIKNVGGRLPTNFWPYIEVGHTDEAAKELKNIFNGKIPFDTPKPSRLIQRVLQIATQPDAIVLDSFAGSGTTAHAVLNLNKQDGGHRKFILIEMMDYADTITAERVKRVIQGYGKGKNQVEGTGGDFSFYELGKPIFKGEFLNETIGLKEIRKYVYFTETRQPLPVGKAEEPAYLGTWMEVAYYFHYEPQKATTLNWDFLATIKTRAEAYVIYADTCALSEKELLDYHITFKKIPRDIARF